MNPSGRNTAAAAFFRRSQRTSVGSTICIVGTPSSAQAWLPSWRRSDVHDGPLSAEHLVEADLRTLGVGHPRLRDLPAHCAVAYSAQEALPVSRGG